MLENYTTKILANCFLAKAVRKVIAQSTVLGIVDAMQNPNAVLQDMGKTEPGMVPEVVADQAPVVSEASPPPIPLPKSSLLGLANKSGEEEPDRPGVPPKRVRRPRRKRPDLDAPPEKPATTEEPPKGSVE